MNTWIIALIGATLCTFGLIAVFAYLIAVGPFIWFVILIMIVYFMEKKKPPSD